MNYLVLDTNIPLMDVNNVVELGSQADTVLVFPETVLDELDAKKSGLNELAYQSRAFARMISKCDYPIKVQQDGMTISQFKYNNIHLWVVALDKYPAYEDTAPNIINDRKIIDAALHFEKVYSPVTFISNDTMCRIRANSLGLAVQDFKIVDKVDYEFTKTLEVSDEVFRNLHGKRITDIDKDHKVEHYNYKFTTPESEQIKIATINNETITILGKDTEADLRKQDVNPQGADQLLLSKAILDPTVNLVVCEALAGSGFN